MMTNPKRWSGATIPPVRGEGEDLDQQRLGTEAERPLASGARERFDYARWGRGGPHSCWPRLAGVSTGSLAVRTSRFVAVVGRSLAGRRALGQRLGYPLGVATLPVRPPEEYLPLAGARRQFTVSISSAERQALGWREVERRMKAGPLARQGRRPAPPGLPSASARGGQSRIGKGTGPAGVAERMASQPVFVSNPQEVRAAGRMFAGERSSVGAKPLAHPPHARPRRHGTFWLSLPAVSLSGPYGRRGAGAQMLASALGSVSANRPFELRLRGAPVSAKRLCAARAGSSNGPEMTGQPGNALGHHSKIVSQLRARRKGRAGAPRHESVAQPQASPFGAQEGIGYQARTPSPAGERSRDGGSGRSRGLPPPGNRTQTMLLHVSAGDIPFGEGLATSHSGTRRRPAPQFGSSFPAKEVPRGSSRHPGTKGQPRDVVARERRSGASRLDSLEKPASPHTRPEVGRLLTKPAALVAPVHAGVSVRSGPERSVAHAGARQAEAPTRQMGRALPATGSDLERHGLARQAARRPRSRPGEVGQRMSQRRAAQSFHLSLSAVGPLTLAAGHGVRPARRSSRFVEARASEASVPTRRTGGAISLWRAASQKAIFAAQAGELRPLARSSRRAREFPKRSPASPPGLRRRRSAGVPPYGGAVSRWALGVSALPEDGPRKAAVTAHRVSMRHPHGDRAAEVIARGARWSATASMARAEIPGTPVPSRAMLAGRGPAGATIRPGVATITPAATIKPSGTKVQPSGLPFRRAGIPRSSSPRSVASPIGPIGVPSRTAGTLTFGTAGLPVAANGPAPANTAERQIRPKMEIAKDSSGLSGGQALGATPPSSPVAGAMFERSASMELAATRLPGMSLAASEAPKTMGATSWASQGPGPSRPGPRTLRPLGPELAEQLDQLADSLDERNLASLERRGLHLQAEVF